MITGTATALVTTAQPASNWIITVLAGGAAGAIISFFVSSIKTYFSNKSLKFYVLLSLYQEFKINELNLYNGLSLNRGFLSLFWEKNSHLFHANTLLLEKLFDINYLFHIYMDLANTIPGTHTLEAFAWKNNLIYRRNILEPEGKNKTSEIINMLAEQILKINRKIDLSRINENVNNIFIYESKKQTTIISEFTDFHIMNNDPEHYKPILLREQEQKKTK